MLFTARIMTMKIVIGQLFFGKNMMVSDTPVNRFKITVAEKSREMKSGKEWIHLLEVYPLALQITCDMRYLLVKFLYPNC
jgi:hypothetical protein